MKLGGGGGKKWLIYQEFQMDGPATKNGCQQLMYAKGDGEEEIRAPKDVSGVHGW